MYIKQVIIQGFRSYRDETVIEPFSPRYNIIVGRNGCGKSNFFFAIQFVLSDEFSNLSAEGRYNLMHEGINSRALNAYVEIVFDNSDSRIMIDKPEVAVRRQISGKKDNYFLDRKVVNKTDIINMLEGAGFSRSNPYYIVKQGKITQMAIAPDANRLQLLREVAGTKVYDEKKQESEAILAETEERRKKIADLLKAIEDRLSSLETEKEELKQYQKWDRSKRGLECAICMSECDDAKKRIDEIVAKMNGATQKIEQLESDRLSITELIQQTTDTITELKQRLQTQQIERETLIIDNKDNFQRKAQIELELQDLQGETEQRDVKRNDLKKELAKYDKLLHDSEQQLTTIIPDYDLLRREEEQKTAQRDLAEEKRKDLFAKRGRGNQFNSKEDRDKWIRLELKSLNKAIHDKREQMQRLKNELEDETIKSQEIEEQLRQIGDNGSEQRAHMNNVNTNVRDLRQKKSDIASQKTDLARKETQLHMQLSQTRDELRKYQDTLRSIMNKGAASGADGLQRLLRQFADENRNKDIINAYHGTLIENIDCDSAFHTAVEVIAGNRLNYHIVDSDIIATRLVKEFNSARLRGEIHFLPLNVLEVQNNNLSNISGASPLIDQLQWIPKAERAVRHVFNRIMLCEDFNSATRTARQYDVDCVTLDGDQVQRKGALTGGYIDKKVSRMELQRTIQQLRTKIANQEQEYDKLRNEIMNIDNEHNNIMTELQREDMKSKKNWDNYEQMKSDGKHLQSELDRIITHRPAKERQLNALNATIEQFCAKEESLKSEVGGDLVSQLSTDEQRTVDQLNDTIEQITQELKEIIRKRVELEGTKTRLEHQIANNYRKNRDRISTDLERMHVENVRSTIEELEREYAILSEKLNEHEKQTDAIDRIINNLDQELKSKQKELEQSKNAEKDIDEHINDEKRNTDRYEVKLRNAQNKLDESTKRQNDIGVPPDGLDKYKDIPTKQLQRDLDRAVVELKKYAHVNKKALDQFLQFSDERDKLTNRKGEIDEAHRHIVDLIESLDNKRFETIQFTFKQVSLYFTEVFKRLVPEGTAHLVIKKGDNEDYDSEQVSSQSSSQQMSVDEFTGVGIKVSFSGRNNEMRDMQQLSGGQKSLVALALIFSIQKCDPAPFYLFDEIDQALDPQYRHAVADMINELSQKAQFIITTFGPDLLKYGDKFYGITYRNKVSQIRSVTREEALEFVEDNDAQNQAAPTMLGALLNYVRKCPQVMLMPVRTSVYTNVTAQDLWKTITSVSNAGAKRGRAKRRGATKFKDLNLGQRIGQGKSNIQWPGLNAPVMQGRDPVPIAERAPDPMREQNLLEVRNRLDRFRRLSIPPSERGFTGGSPAGKSLGQPNSMNEITFDNFDSRLVEFKTLQRTIGKIGRKKFTSAFVAVGNGQGLVGYGKALTQDAQQGLQKAKTIAARQLLYIPVCDGHTIFHDFYEPYYFTKVRCEKRPSGYGLRCHRIIALLCKLIGIKDMYAKIDGAINPQNITKAFIRGLLKQKTYQDWANAKQLHLVEYRPERDYFPHLLASPSNGQPTRTSLEIDPDEDLDFERLCFEGRTLDKRQTAEQYEPWYATKDKTRYGWYKYLRRRHWETVQENATVERLARMDEKRYDSYYRYPDEYHTDVLKQQKQRLPHVWYPRV